MFLNISVDPKVKPLVVTVKLKVYPVFFENDWTEPLSSLQFDEKTCLI